MSTKLKELRDKLAAKQEVLATIFDEAKLNDGTFDFLKASAFKMYNTQEQCLEQVRSQEAELKEIHTEYKTLEGIVDSETKINDMRREFAEANHIDEPHVHSGAPSGVPHRLYQKSLGQLVADYMPKERARNGSTVFEKEFPNFEVKTLMQTSAGWAPEATRIPRVVEYAFRPIQITDLMPVGNTTQAAVVYMEETTRTNAAAETAEAAAMPESALAFTERTVTVRKIATYIPVTDEQLADVPQVQALIDNRLRSFVAERLDSQIIVGDGTGVNMTGFISTPNVQTQAKGTDPTPDAIYKAMVKVRITGRAVPSAVIINPADWQDIRLLRTAEGQYIWGNPSEAGPMRIWGLPVVEADVITENTALVGDFTNHAQLVMRQGVEVLAGFINDDFIKGRQAIRVTMRGVLVVFRPSAFCLITGI